MWHLIVIALSLLVVTSPYSVEAQQSLLQRIQAAPNISIFAQLLNNTGVSVEMSSGTCSTFKCLLVFAPNNAAFTAAYRGAGGVTNLSRVDQKAIVDNLYLSVFAGGSKGFLRNWTSAGSPVGIDVGFGTSQILENDATLYWLRKASTNTFHVNNAKIINSESDQEGSNGVYHVLDQVPLPIGSSQNLQGIMDSGTAPLINQLKIGTSITYFNKWMAEDAANGPYYKAMIRRSTSIKVRTLFLPNDQAWQDLGTDGLNALESSMEAKRELIAAHFALNYVLFTGWMSEVASVNFKTGLADLKQFPARMYVDSKKQAFVSSGGVVASFIDSAVNYPLRDTVIHVINKPLGFLYKSLATLAKDHAPSFFTACANVSSCYAMMHSNTTNYTLFAPQSIDSLNGVTGAQLEQVLRLHFVASERVSRPEMTETAMLTASNNSGHIRFRLHPNSTVMVEGRLTGHSYVPSRLIRSDEAATNGIFHLIQSPLGQPDKNIVELLASLQESTNVSAYLGRSGFDPALNSPSQPATVFAPSNAAMQRFSARRNSNGDAIGEQILMDQVLRDRVLRRMVIPNQRVHTNALNAGSYRYATANTVENEQVTLTLTGNPGASDRTATLNGAEVTARVNLSIGPYEATNGVVYLLDTALFRDGDVQGYTRSGWQLKASNLVLLLMGFLPLLALLQ